MNQFLYFLLPLILILCISLLLLERFSRKQNIPQGFLIYSDLGQTFSPPRALVSRKYSLRGRPDSIYRTRDGYIPIELKSSNAGDVPHEGHVQQLMAYCLLIEENYGQAPAYGLIQYNNKQFKISYTEVRREQLLEIMQEMRSILQQADLIPPRVKSNRCNRCGYKGACSKEQI